MSTSSARSSDADSRRSASIAVLVVLCFTAICLAWPALGVVRDIAGGWSHGTHKDIVIPWALAGRTLLICLLIAMLAALLAAPVAWSWRERKPSAAATILLLSPLSIPSYLAYSGWGLVRAPGTWLGDKILTATPAGTPNPWPEIAGNTQAILGLALFAWPLAALPLWIGFASIDSTIHQALRLEPISRFARVRATFAMIPGSLVTCIALPALIMLGSAVPLHLAQIETLAIDIWRTLDHTPANEQWRVWLHAWPLLMLAAIGAGWLARLGSRTTLDHASDAPAAPKRRSAPFFVLLLLSFIIPVLLQARSLSGPRALTDFVDIYRQAIADSLLVSASVAVFGTVLCIATWASTRSSGMPARIARLVLMLWMFAGLIPGILVGLATSHAWSRGPAFVYDTPIILILGHLARYGFIPMLAGFWLASTEPRPLRDLLALDGAVTFARIARVMLVPRWGYITVVSIATGLLSFHEIEASVIIQPPGFESFARTMLQNLHYLRDDALAAGVVVVAVVFVTLTLLFSFGGFIHARRESRLGND